jgi:glycosyltransferase involved in cell wall biosynthesis
MDAYSDWIGYVGNPEDGAVVGGRLDSMEFPDTDPYDVIVVQQVYGPEWARSIEKWQTQGKKVIYEIDDFIHGIYKIKEHPQKGKFNKKRVKEYVECMGMCDALIVSTDRLAEFYKKYNDNVHVCRNSLDTKRYDVQLPVRDWITIGWAGGTGHDLAIDPWLGAVATVMKNTPNVGFCSIGTPYASLMEELYPTRCLTVPWVSIENLPYALANFDIVIAPAHESKYHLAKSDLRWLEAGAVGLPVIADERIYNDVEDSVTGITLNGEKEDMLERVQDELHVLIYDEDERKTLGANAKKYISDKRDIRQGVEQWDDAISSVVN